MGYNSENFEELKKVLRTYGNELQFVDIDPEASTIKIKIQDGPIKEHGRNGSQIDMLGCIWGELIRLFNTKFPCRENSITITKIEEALMWQGKRKADREKRKVEGTDQV